MDELKELLMASAREKGICADGYAEMRTGDIDSLVDFYIQNPDWCLERDYPDLHTLGESFANYEHKGVYVNKIFHGELLNDLQTYVFHNCKGTIRVGLNVDKGIIPMLYLANGCRLRIVGVGDTMPGKPSGVPLYLFGKNDVSARDNKYVVFKRFAND